MRKKKRIFVKVAAAMGILYCASFLAYQNTENVEAASTSAVKKTVTKSTDNQTMFQAYEWYMSNNGNYWNEIGKKSKELSKTGFTSVWLPPAYKGLSGTNSVGYDPYDLYDLGEFNQMGTVRTKYGTKNQYLSAINKLHSNGIKVYADAVMNHKAGADSCEDAIAYKVGWNNRLQTVSGALKIKSWTVFKFPGRNGKYSSFKWDKSCFDGVDYDQRSGSNAIYRFRGKSWDRTDTENGNYDYLMYTDIDLNSPKVRNELKNWGKWYVNTANLDGFRIDAVKHMEFSFVGDWVSSVEKKTGKDLFAVSEYYSGDVNKLKNYIKTTNGTTSLFDFPLYYKFKSTRLNSSLSSLLNGTLASTNSKYAVTFVDNHDTQIGQSDSTVQRWFKPSAYTFILTRQEGYPCVFYGDYYGSGNNKTKANKEMIDALMAARKYFAYGTQTTKTAFNGTVMGWTRHGDSTHKYSGLAALITTSKSDKSMKMYVGKSHAGEKWIDITGNTTSSVKISKDGYGTFKVKRASNAVYVNKKGLTKFIKTGKVSGLKLYKAGTSYVRLKWTAVDNAKYNVYKYNYSKKTWSKVASSDKNSVIIRNLGSASKNKFKVKAYRALGENKIYGAQSSELTTVTKPKSTTLTAKAGKGKVSLKWKKTSSNVDGYVIYMAKNKNGKYSKVAQVKKASSVKKTIKGLKSGKIYYFKVVSYRQYKPTSSSAVKTVYSSSSKATAKIK